MPFSRKDFIAASALGASAAAAAASGLPAAAQQRAKVHFAVLKPSEFDSAEMLRKLAIDNPHKQVFESVSPLVIAPGIASVYIHMQNSMNAYQFSLGMGSLAALAVFIGPSIVFGLNDATWKKYGLGKAFGPDMPLAATNVYYKAGSHLDPNVDPNDPNGMYQDWSAQAILKRGGQFFICHNATTAIASIIAQKRGMDPKRVLADFSTNLLPGFQMVPAGVAAVQQAQESGWKLYAII